MLIELEMPFPFESPFPSQVWSVGVRLDAGQLERLFTAEEEFSYVAAEAPKIKADLKATMTLCIASRVVWEVVRSCFFLFFLCVAHLSSSACVEPFVWLQRDCWANMSLTFASFVLVKSNRDLTSVCALKRCTPWANTAILQSLQCCCVVLVNLCSHRLPKQKILQSSVGFRASPLALCVRWLHRLHTLIP